MGETEAADAAQAHPQPLTPASRRPKLSVLPLVALIFFDVSGGPFGVEDSVGAGGGPLLSLVGFLLFPVLWSLPEALITAELATLFPSNGGYVVWISSAFGRFWGFQEGIWKFISGAMDNALYPVLFLDYLKQSIPFFAPGSPGRPFALVAVSAGLTFLNYRGLHIVGFSAIVLTVFSLSPFIVLSVLALPRIRPHRWLVSDIRRTDWRSYFNSMFWNLNYWDKASALAGEVEDPSRSFPRAIFGGVGLVVASYLVPLLAGTGATDVSMAREWRDGYFAQVGLEIGGEWLRLWIQAAAAMSNMGLFEAEMSSDSFQLLGMSEMGMIPEIFSMRSKYGTPTISILCSATGVLFLSWLNFQEILEFLNFLYALGMLLEFAAFIVLRIKKPDLERPYKVPVNTFWAIIICIPPSFLLILVMCLASIRTLVVSATVLLLGVILYPAIQYTKERKWLRFISPPGDLGSCHGELHALPSCVPDEASVGLLLDPASIKESQGGEAISEAIYKLE